MQKGFVAEKITFQLTLKLLVGPVTKLQTLAWRWPGSTHDSRIFDNSFIRAKFENNEMSGLLLGDQGYACRRYLMTPLRNPDSQAELRYNSSLKKLELSQKGFLDSALWKRRFPIVGSIIRLKLETTLTVIVAAAVLFNISKLRNDLLEDAAADGDIAPDDAEAANDMHAEGNAVRRDIINRFFT